MGKTFPADVPFKKFCICKRFVPEYTLHTHFTLSGGLINSWLSRGSNSVIKDNFEHLLVVWDYFAVPLPLEEIRICKPLEPEHAFLTYFSLFYADFAHVFLISMSFKKEEKFHGQFIFYSIAKIDSRHVFVFKKKFILFFFFFENFALFCVRVNWPKIKFFPCSVLKSYTDSYYIFSFVKVFEILFLFPCLKMFSEYKNL